jgi:hypothetical protein
MSNICPICTSYMTFKEYFSKNPWLQCSCGLNIPHGANQEKINDLVKLYFKLEEERRKIYMSTEPCESPIVSHKE